MRKIRVKICLLILVVLVMSCDDGDKGEDSQDNSVITDGNGKAGYSGITEVDENMIFKKIDPNDWRDDGLLEDCLAYPNPIKRTSICYEMVDQTGTLLTGTTLKVRYRTRSEAYVAIMIRDSSSNVICPTVEESFVNEWGEWRSNPVNFTFPLHYTEGESEVWTQNMYLCIHRSGKSKPLDTGLYRLFIYASESELIMNMLRDTGTTNASRDKYSMVYGDILIAE
jgi:hypothetical protein